MGEQRRCILRLQKEIELLTRAGWDGEAELSCWQHYRCPEIRGSRQPGGWACPKGGASACDRVLARRARSLAVLTRAILVAHLSSSNAAAEPLENVSPAPLDETITPKQAPPAPRWILTTRHSAIRSTPDGQQRQVRPPPPEREVARRVAVTGGVLVLPTVARFGVPVILDVPEIGYVELSEDRYVELYGNLSSADPEQVQGAIAVLREIKAAEDAEVEAMQHATLPTDSDGDVPVVFERDLSEPISFGASHPRFQLHRHFGGSRRLY